MPDDTGGWERIEAKPSDGWTRLKGAIQKVQIDQPAGPSAKPSIWEGLWEGLKHGGREQLEGAAQIGARMGPEEGAAAFTDPKDLERRRETVDTAAQESEKAYQESRARQQHPIAAGIGRIAGNIGATAPLALVPGAGLGGVGTRTGAGLLARGALSGAAEAATQPVMRPQDYWTEKIKQAGVGAAVGGAIPGVASAVSPRLPNAQLVQNMTGFSRAFRPLYNFFTGAEERTVNGFDRTVARQVLDPIGGKIDGKPAGHELMRQTEDQISNEYNRILPNVIVQRENATRVDPELDDFVATMSEDHRHRFNELVDRQINKRFADTGIIDGPTFQRARSEMWKRAHSWIGTNDDELGRAVMQKLDHLDQAVTESNPQWAPELKKANESFRLWARMRQAGAAPKKEGKFTPDDLLTAIGRQEKGRTWRGDKPLQGYAIAARQAMGKERTSAWDLVRLFHRHGLVGEVMGDVTGPAARGMKGAAPIASPAAGQFIGREMRLPQSPEDRAKQRLKAAAKVGEIQKERLNANKRGDILTVQKLGKQLAEAHRDYRDLGGTA